MKKSRFIICSVLIALVFLSSSAALSFFDKVKAVAPQGGILKIPVSDISDGKAHFFKVRADDKTLVTFFVLKSSDGAIRAAVDACHVCYRSGKGYVQKGSDMVCENCGQRFAGNRIGVVSGGCNPAPLASRIQEGQVVIEMKDINKNSWLCEFKNQK